MQLRGVFVEVVGRHQALGHTNEFGHTPIDAANLSQHIAQDVVDQPLHGRQGNLHGSHSKKSPAVYGASAGLETLMRRLVSGLRVDQRRTIAFDELGRHTFGFTAGQFDADEGGLRAQ